MNDIKQLFEAKNEITLKTFEIPEEKYPNLGILYSLQSECKKIIAFLDVRDENVIPTKEIDRLNKLKNEFDQIGVSDFHLIKNVNYSIELYEKGEPVASALVASRVVSAIITQFLSTMELKQAVELNNNQSGKNKKTKEELIIRTCVEKRIIKNDDNSKRLKK